MPHQSYTTSIPGSVYRNGVSESTCSDALYSREFCLGVKRIKPEGWIPPISYYFTRDAYERHAGLLQYNYSVDSGPVHYGDLLTDVVGIGTGTGVESLALLDYVYSSTGIPSSWRDKALIKARLAMKDQDVNLGEAFAERNQTARLLGDTCLKLWKSAKALKRGNFAGAAKALGISKPRPGRRGHSIPQQWLELQYGWKPLLSDVHGAVTALASRDKSKWIITSKGSMKETFDLVYHGPNVASPDYGSGKASGMKGVYVRIDAIPQNDVTIAMASAGVLNPLDVAWELLPFSFVVDWALPVGDYLNSLDALLGYGPTWCSISTFERSRISHTLVGTAWETTAGSTVFHHTYRREGSAHRERVSLNREVLDTVPLPLMPRFKDPASFGHLANGLSLLAQVFGKR